MGPGLPYEEEFYDAEQNMEDLEDHDVIRQGQVNYRLASASELTALFEGDSYEAVTKDMKFYLEEEYGNVLQHSHHNQQENKPATDDAQRAQRGPALEDDNRPGGSNNGRPVNYVNYIIWLPFQRLLLLYPYGGLRSNWR